MTDRVGGIKLTHRLPHVENEGDPSMPEVLPTFSKPNRAGKRNVNFCDQIEWVDIDGPIDNTVDPQTEEVYKQRLAAREAIRRRNEHPMNWPLWIGAFALCLFSLVGYIKFLDYMGWAKSRPQPARPIALPDIGTFLRTAGCESYESEFINQGVDMETLLLMRAEHLKEMGLKMGLRVRLEEALQREKERLVKLIELGNPLAISDNTQQRLLDEAGKRSKLGSENPTAQVDR